MDKEICDECYKCYWFWSNNDTGDECFGYCMPCIDFKRKEGEQDE